MAAFMDENFLLSSKTAKTLYHDYAKEMPIIDYHCHLSPKEIYENKTYKNLTEVWLYGDHYKWRLMRANGVEESHVTGDAGDYDKFLAFAKTVQVSIGNPVHQWSHLELRRYFGIDEIISEANAPIIWEKANAKLTGSGFGARDFIVKSNVEVVCTTDDPVDSLEYHIKLREDKSFPVKVLPSFRPDKGLEINRKGFVEWIQTLGRVTDAPIKDYEGLLAALEARVDFFHSVGGRVSDHALDYVPFASATKDEAAAIFAKALRGEAVSAEEETKYKTCTLVFLGKLYAARGWVMQYHMNAARNNNTRMFGKLGPDTGFDAMNDTLIAMPLSRLLDAMDAEDALPKTILYSLNPTHNAVIGTMMGCFQGGGVAGKMQFGSAWWFNDTREGMIAQMKTLADVGLLSRFVGMLTDSRSFLSYTRHEYFRRILCNLIAEWVENGEVPEDTELLGGIVQNISYNNAKAYFDFA
ncbi:glucuronate isomerase [Paenibacillus nanensis]|uniref:Uronate isomerase n=1 Tax=Paenibacillus nanensis TaxID=393251 RepID=A0A3A1VHD4_9BACL|nr:glucuronate isomerase [Paenibacillus nanensis]RIX60348.1 glucuronate isomerase [Paenibacillus nanensis]